MFPNMFLIEVSIEKLTLFLCWLYIYHRVIDQIFDVVDGHIENDTLFTGLKMHALPVLHGHFVKLIKFLVCTCSTVTELSSIRGRTIIVAVN